MNPKDLPVNESFEHIISTTSRAISVTLSRSFQNAGMDVTAEQWSILQSLWRKDGQCQYELAMCQGKDRPSITRLLDNMEKHNWVLRIPSKEDRRHKFIYLTNKGKELQAKLTEIADKTLDDALNNVSAKEIEQTKDILKKIRANLFK